MDLQTLTKQCAPAKILAVSKLQPEDRIRALYAQGQRQFGENYVQEALEKIQHLQDLQIEWHLIGSLQKNKAKFVVGQFALIHSVDSLELAEVLSRQCVNKKVSQNILLQVNVAHEDSKGGFTPNAVKSLWGQLTELPQIHIQGFMTMPPLTETGAEVRPYFMELRHLRDELKTKTNLSVHSLQELSMGTSHDYPVAIEEGATIVRLGTILFGERPMKR
ncbi:MAG: YggS family pyridoxal phosphate-dependent enzyme [Bdellovibrio sp.]|nr:YggS family pyridoxal phosphate-dependent enzyme [Bdellovibrio sp.]